MKSFTSDSTIAVLLIGFVALIFFNDWFGVMPFYARALSVLGLMVHISFAIGVGRDASRRNNDGRLLFVDPLTWSIAVAVFGMMGVALYWLLHMSNLRNDL